MKERIVLEIPKDMCDNCNGCDKPTSALVECFLDEPRQVYETIKVPETFSDLLTLCKNTKGCFVLRISNGEYIEVPTDLIGYSFTFYQDGRIFADEDVCIKEKATPQQMWQIIKNLVGDM